MAQKTRLDLTRWEVRGNDTEGLGVVSRESSTKQTEALRRSAAFEEVSSRIAGTGRLPNIVAMRV
jgi:hypothetical protein